MHNTQPSHSAAAYLTSKIDESGPMRFDEFMAFALYDPRFGYYARGDRIFAKEGDFITAPELTPLFGETLADLIGPHLASVGGCVYEFGAGRGRLAGDLIRSLGAELNEYVIVELSGGLRHEQQQWLRSQLDDRQLSKVKWIDSWPETLNGFVLGNELLDAMPVRRLRLQDGVWSEGWVGCGPAGAVDVGAVDVDAHRGSNAPDSDSRQLAWIWKPADPALQAAIAAAIPEIETLPQPYFTEIGEQAPAWVKSLTERLHGHCLMIDYGWSAGEYYAPQHAQGHLRAHSQHTAHDDFLLMPGDQDLTSHVNFTAILEAIGESGGELEGYASQGGLLLDAGLLDKAAKRVDLTDPKRGLAVRQALQTLVSESDMGLSFKAMCWSKGVFLNEDSRLVQAFLHRDLSPLL